MFRSKGALLAFLFFILLGVAIVGLTTDRPSGPEIAPGDAPSDTATTTEPMSSYRNETYGIAFTYPQRYIIEERDSAEGELPYHLIMLAENTPDLQAAKSTTTPPREGPPTINVQIFENTEKPQNAAEWIETAADHGYIFLPEEQISELDVGGKPAYLYRTDGLYAGYAFIVDGGDRIYLFTVGYIDLEDRIIDDYNALLDSVEFI